MIVYNCNEMPNLIIVLTPQFIQRDDRKIRTREVLRSL